MVIPEEWFASATALKRMGKEIDFRNCISRAYYSAYHAALLVANMHYPTLNSQQRMGSHERLIHRFRSSPNRQAQQVGQALKKLKSQRCRADYEVDEKVTVRDAEKALEAAAKMPALLASCSHPSQLTDYKNRASPRGHVDQTKVKRPSGTNAV